MSHGREATHLRHKASVFIYRGVIFSSYRAASVIYDAPMPELPEVETVRRGLAPHIEGRTITRVTLNRKDLRFPFPEGFAARLEGARITRFTRRAKYLLAELETDTSPLYWLSHLGMTGRYMLYQHDGAHMEPGQYAHDVSAETAEKHVHVRLQLDDGSALTYADPRRFGFMDLFEGRPENSRFLAHLGPEPLGNEFDAAVLYAACEGRKSPIKNVLLDQAVVAGLGNIYVCEALFLSGISPRRLACNVGRARIDRLVPAIRDVLNKAITVGGSTLRDFVSSDGSQGNFQDEFRVYDRADKPCSSATCHASVKRIVQSGRSSFYCPQCQK
jgi:formamidopyrimidine-DNA glycosylase